MPTLQSNSGAYTIIGVASNNAYVLPIAVGSYVQTGTAATTRHGYQVVNPPGTYAITGQAIQVRRISAFPAGYQIQGTAATLTRSQVVVLLAVSGSYLITGNTATVFIRSVPASLGVYVLTGTVATLTRSSGAFSVIANSGSYTSTGTATAFITTAPMNSGEYLLLGTVATLRHGFTSQANSGSYLIVGGSPTTLEQTFHITSAVGSYSITPQNTGLIRSVGNKVIPAEFGSYSVAGQLATLNVKLNAAVGVYTLSGTAANFKRTIFAELGIYSIAGTTVGFLHNSLVSSNSGSYTLAGTVAELRGVQPRISAVAGLYTTFGFASSLRAARYITLQPGVYTTTGVAAFLRATQIVSTFGVYNTTGVPATLTASRVGRWRKHPPRPATNKVQPESVSTWDEQPVAPGI